VWASFNCRATALLLMLLLMLQMLRAGDACVAPVAVAGSMQSSPRITLTHYIVLGQCLL